MTQAVTLAQLGGADTPFFRNRLINGAMVIDQRNAGASFSSSVNGAYNLDRWYNQNNSGGTKFSVQQNAGSVTPPAGFTNYLGVTSTSAYTVTSSDVIGIGQYIEGYNVADLGWGTANAKTVTLSFWVRSSLTGTFGGSLNEANAGTAYYPYTYTISASNTWEYKTVTVVGPTTGTWQTGNLRGINVLFNLGTGSTYSGTAGSWSASPNYAPTGATSVVGTNGATFYITGVQLEIGTQASPFERRLYGSELSLCQRYYYSLGGETAFQNINTVIWYNSTECVGQFSWPVTMRAIPTVSKSGNWTTLGSGSGGPNLSGDQITTKNMQLGAYGGSGGTAGYGATLRANNDTSLRVTFSAEL